MMVDYALELERSGKTRWRNPQATISGGQPCALSPHHDDDAGCISREVADRIGDRRWRGCGRPLGIAVVGGLLLSRALTLTRSPPCILRIPIV